MLRVKVNDEMTDLGGWSLAEDGMIAVFNVDLVLPFLFSLQSRDWQSRVNVNVTEFR